MVFSCILHLTLGQVGGQKLGIEIPGAAPGVGDEVCVQIPASDAVISLNEGWHGPFMQILFAF